MKGEMGRKVIQPDPLRSRASRVEKHHRPKKEFPAWYNRVAAIEITKRREVYPEDFDEDISELEEADESDDDEDEDTVDEESESSYEGSDAEYYYELKDDREKRKQELLELRKEKEKEIKFEKSQEEVVNTAYDKFKKARRRARKKGKTMPIDSIVGQEFKLFSADYIDGSDYELHGTKRVSFYSLDEDENDDMDVSRTGGKKVAGEKQIYGDLYLDAEASCSFGPIPLPTRARRKDVKVEFKTKKAKYDLWFKFFANGYLKLSVSRDLAFLGGSNSSSVFPGMIEFVGILTDREKERRERAEEQGRIAKNRPASPRESWFEMNHSMGSWAQSHW